MLILVLILFNIDDREIVGVCIYIYNYIYIYIYYIFNRRNGVFRWPPWKELSCKLQTALAQAQQEHGFCVEHCVCGCFCVKQLFV